MSTDIVSIPPRNPLKRCVSHSIITLFALNAAPIMASETPHLSQPPMADKIDGPLVKAAASHASLLRSVKRSERTALSSAHDLNSTMDDLSGLVTQGFSEGLTAYGALIGAQTSPFIDGIYARVKTEGLDSVAYALYADPDYVTQITGVAAAAANITAAWQRNSQQISGAGTAFKQRSYDLQKDPAWQKQRADNRQDRLKQFKQAGGIRHGLSQEETYQIASAAPISSMDTTGPQRRQSFALIYGSSENTPPSTALAPQNAYSPILKKTLTLAALEAIGATGKDSHDWLKNYMRAPVMNQCLNWARLNTEQCLAAGHFKYEDAFCVAEHQLTETRDCMEKSGFN